MAEKTDIQNFYSNQSIFITGGSGFIGKVLIEKLLRVCTDLKTIYILVRPKKNKTSEERFQEIFNQACFNPIKLKNFNFKEKVKLIEGDCTEVDLGLKPEDRRLLKKEINIIFHVAADVRFDQVLKYAAYSNVRAVKDVLELAKETMHLKAVIHVSTAYSVCPQTHIMEEFYEPGMNFNSLLSLVDLIDEDTLNAITTNLLKKWPNTYTFTKAIAEDLIRTEGKHLPIAIVRPGIIVGTVNEPSPGWVDNFYGIIGVGTGVLMGVIKTVHSKKDNIVNCVPCDYVVNTMISAAWSLSTKTITTFEQNKAGSNIPIYNYTGHDNSLQTLGELDQILKKNAIENPVNLMFWHSNHVITSSELWFNIRFFFIHTVFSYIIDFFLPLFGQKPIAVRKFRTIKKLLKVLSYFGLNSWHFDIKNVYSLWERMTPADQKLFQFNMKEFDWDLFYRNSFIYGRIYLLNEPLELLPKARTKRKIFAAVHYTLMTICLYYLCKLMLLLYTFLSNYFFS